MKYDAIKNAIDWQIKLKAEADTPAPVKGAKRIRTTGHISQGLLAKKGVKSESLTPFATIAYDLPSLQFSIAVH